MAGGDDQTRVPQQPPAAKAGNAAPDKPATAQRIAHVLAAALVFVVLPMLLVGVLVGQFGVGAMAIGLGLGVVGSKIGGTRRMAYIAPLIGIAGGLGAVTAYNWWWVMLLATSGVISGADRRCDGDPTPSSPVPARAAAARASNRL